MANITGEKLHVNHFLLAFERAGKECGLALSHFRAVPNLEQLRYDLYVEVPSGVEAGFLRQSWLPSLDRALAAVNVEYEQKRASRRLRPPCLYVMPQGWASAEVADRVRRGARDTQYKWQYLCPAASDADIRAAVLTVQLAE